MRDLGTSAAAPAVTPAVGTRSVNECFYGERWAPEDRIAVMRTAAAFGANAYVYGPSADRRTGGLWREHYSGAEREVMAGFARACRAAGVEPIWRISPAAPLEPAEAIRVSDPAEIAALVDKLEHVLELGYERVLIAFDDLMTGLDPATAAAFADSAHPIAAAHASVVRRIGERVGFGRLLVCPMHYWGTDPSPYRREFGRGIPAEVPVVWTGPAVISDEIRAEDARAVAEELGHPLWIWDNYPVNDWEVDAVSAMPFHAPPRLDNLVIPRRLPLAPVTGRDPGLVDVVAAIGSNLALDPFTGLPAALTVVDFAVKGSAYDPEESWRAAVSLLDVDADALALLADATGPGSGGRVRTPSSFARACARVLLSDDPVGDGTLTALEAVVAEHLDALTALRERPSRLTRELQPWLVELGRQCHLALLAAAALRGGAGEGSELVLELSGSLGRPSRVSACSGMGRSLAEYARGLIAGGAPSIDLPDAADVER